MEAAAMSTLTARLFGRHASVDRPIVPAPAEPMGVAREILRLLFTDSNNTILLREHRSDLYRWSGTCWHPIEIRDIRAAVYQLLEHAYCVHPVEGMKPFAPTRKKIDDVLGDARDCAGR
jgi:putative DNA primase/helicase